MQLDRPFITLVSIFAAVAAAAQNPDDLEDEVLISIDVGYNTAYRVNTWVPVDVLVVNEQDDLTGYVEVRSYDGVGNIISPVYRLPVECPRDSKKRFRMYAYLRENTTHVEGLLFERGRLAVDAPAYVKVSPIKNDAYMIMLVDNERLNYSFLFTAMEQHRIYVQHIIENQTALMPNQPQAYDAFDAIVIGETNPSRISPDQRIQLEHYVRNGGTVVLMTGLNRARLDDTWIEEFSGLAFGQNTIMTETQLAREALPADLRAGVNENREGLVTELRPTSGGLGRYGHERPLVWRRDLGRGRIYTLPIDAKAHVLQDVEGFHTLWAHMFSRKRNEPAVDLNFVAPARSLAQQLPSLSGVTIRPLSTVMTYLLLYLGLGIVANWIFWSRLKRREMAWVTLVFFSFAFTSYAMISGTSGWAKSAELHTFNVLVHRPQTGLMERHIFTGILTARTREYEGALNAAKPLVRDSAYFGLNDDTMNFGMRTGSQRPYAFLYGAAPRLEDLRVGASELRMTHIEERAVLNGGVDGELVLDNAGIRGTLTNRTGLDIVDPQLLIDGALVPLQVAGNSWDVDQDRASLVRLRNAANENQNNLQWQAYAYHGETQMLNMVRKLFFVDNQWSTRSDLPPLVAGYSETPAEYTFSPDEELDRTFTKTLVIAEVRVDRLSHEESAPLQFKVVGRDYQWQKRGWRQSQEAWLSGVRYHGTQRLDLRVPRNIGGGAVGSIELRILWKTFDDEDLDFSLTPTLDDEGNWGIAHSVETFEHTINGQSVREARYTIEDWESFAVGDQIEFRVVDSTMGTSAQPDSIGALQARERHIWTAMPRAILEAGSTEDDIEWQ